MTDDNEGFSSVPDAPEIDHNCTDHAVCPHCGHEHRDDWEWQGEEGTHECDDCGEPFKWYAEVSRTWDTEKQDSAP
jgi:hypothetical protein